jgi:pimeloyl-ACP methyl ester carboxylesterase
MSRHSGKEQRHEAPQAWSTLRSVDGTGVAWITVGQGPGIVVVPGALSNAEDYLTFADHLSRRFAVHVIERRGRGRSGPQGVEYGIDVEVADVLALQARTGASFVVGHSYGGLIALEAARDSAALRGVAVYEPGVSVNGAISTDWLPRYEQLLAEGRRESALAVFSRATGPDRGRTMPVWVMRAILRVVIPKDRRQAMLDLLPQNGSEHRALATRDNALTTYSAISAPVLLMGGRRSGIRWARVALARLSAVLPTSETILFSGLDHFGLDRGAPDRVAAQVAEFFSRTELLNPAAV